MFDIEINQLVKKDINELFELLSDHENYSSYPGCDKSYLIEQGTNEKNGKGALRFVKLGNIELKERITVFDRPNQLNYQIEHAKPLPFKHELGEIKLVKEGEYTRVNWKSKGHIKIPILGRLLFDKMMDRQGSTAFCSLLKAMERR